MNHLELFDQYRSLLFSIAYNMLGSVMDAEDMVQETFIAWQKVNDTIHSPKAYLTTIITNLCINHLKSARVQRESYLGPWLPEPLVSTEKSAETADALSMAFLVVLEKLSPAERAVFLLRNAFDYSYPEIARILRKSEVACRQLFSRAQRQVRAARPYLDTPPPSYDEQETVLLQFLQACAEGDLQGLLSLLAEDVVSQSDGGGRVSAATLPIFGADRVARYFIGLTAKIRAHVTPHFALVNGQVGVIGSLADQPFMVLSLDIVQGRIRSVCVVVNPEKLAHVSLDER